MAKKTVSELASLIEHQFIRQRNMLPLYQTLADNFYPERADFTFTRNIGTEFSDNLINSYPILVRRDLGNSLSAMLRDGEWFQVGINGEPDHEGQGWLQWASGRLLRLFNDRKSGFARSTREGDHDYATFGQTVISGELNRNADGTLWRCWHLRDCAWWDGDDGHVEGVVRRWSPTNDQLVAHFGRDRVHKNILEKLRDEPFKEATIRHIVMPSRMYGDDEIESRYPFVSIFIDITNEHILEEVGMNYQMYVVPRFQTIAGSAYAYSPATVVGLPDARALQAMTHTLLEAGERYTRPPIIATQKVIRGDVDLSPDGITFVDSEYDERLGAALRPLVQDRGGFPIGLEMRDNIVAILSKAFFLDTLNLPDVGHEMTAFEVSERMKMFRRQNLPLFSPLESEYNGQLCELGFNIAMEAGLLGSPYDIPDSLKDSDVIFKFESPLSSAQEEEKAQQWQAVSGMLAQAAEIDPNVTMNVDVDTAFRDATLGIGAPPRWLHPIEQVQQGRQMAAMAQVAEQAAMMEQPEAAAGG